MALYSDPPPLHLFHEDKPTLLVCWWITLFCAVIIALRVAGRFIRTEKLFREDKAAALALVPLFLRMGCVHVILLYGTNNAQLDEAAVSDNDLQKKEVASGLVLLSRVLYAATLWTLKYAILEFLRRLNLNWHRTYELSLMSVRAVLVATFVAVVISDLAECQPFSRYWQVLPDPGGRCRQGYAQLLTMAVCNVLTDLLLVIFPVPVILGSSMGTKRKIQLVLLFSLSLAPVVVTIYRVPQIIHHSGSQQIRSLYASIELLFATAAANALVLGSFVRDRGVKKRRYKYDSIAAGSLDRSSASESRRPTALRYWGSDEDLVRDMGYGVKPELRDPLASTAEHGQYIPAPLAKPHRDLDSWQFPAQLEPRRSLSRSDDAGDRSIRSDSTATHRRVSFFDYGGLLGDAGNSSHNYSEGSALPSAAPPAVAANSRSRRDTDTSSDQDASPTATTAPKPAVPAGVSGFRRGSAALLQDLGGFLAPPSSWQARQQKPAAKTKPSRANKPVVDTESTELQTFHQNSTRIVGEAEEGGKPDAETEASSSSSHAGSRFPPPPLPQQQQQQQQRIQQTQHHHQHHQQEQPQPQPQQQQQQQQQQQRDTLEERPELQLMDVGGLLKPPKR